MKKYLINKQDFFKWQTYFKLAVILISISSIFYSIIAAWLGELAKGEESLFAIFRPSYNNGEFDHQEFVGINLLLFLTSKFSWFTLLSNIVVLFWFSYAFIFPNKEGEGKILGFVPTIVVTSWITITCLVFNIVSIPALHAGKGESYPIIWWIIAFIMHLIIPLLMVIYIFFGFEVKQTQDIKSMLKKQWFLIISFPLIYGLFILIRGEITLMFMGYDRKVIDFLLDIDYWPYFFLKLRDPNGMAGIPNVAWFFIMLIMIFGIAIGFSCLYNKVITIIQIKKNKKLKKDTKNIANN